MTTTINIRLASNRVNNSLVTGDKIPRLFTPGEVIISQQNFMRGHGTYGEDDVIKASVAGCLEQVNKLISIKPLKSRYVGEVGDVVVARIIDVQQKRWKVDTNSRLDSVLLLSSVNLPGGELRRRSVEDEHMMRKYLQEGDLISAEVQSIFDDGSVSLHTRSLKYGKLSQGILVKVFPSLVKRRKTHFHNLSCGASIILGNNGFIWISPTVNSEIEGDGGFTQNLSEPVPRPEREVIVRLRNCILALANCKMMLYDTSVLYAYEESMKYEVDQLLHQEAIFERSQHSRDSKVERLACERDLRKDVEPHLKKLEFQFELPFTLAKIGDKLLTNLLYSLNERELIQLVAEKQYFKTNYKIKYPEKSCTLKRVTESYTKIQI